MTAADTPHAIQPLSPALMHFITERKRFGLSNFDGVVLLAMHARLDWVKFSPVKVESVALQFGFDKSHLNASLERLARIGYLHCGADDPDAPTYARATRPSWYRLSWCLPSP
jgi:hypothetical protein